VARSPITADLSNKTAIVTGANSGIGKQIAENLAGLGAHVVMACRNEERGQVALDDIATRVGADELELMLLDQSSQASVRDFAAAFASRRGRLDILVNNAGIYPSTRELTEEGIENTWATNVMGYFLLTRLLQEQLVASAPARVVFVASKLAGGLDMNDLQWEQRKFGGIKAYKQSKQANRMISHVFAEKLAGTGVSVNAVHPGGINTGIGRNHKGVYGFFLRLAFKTQKPVTEGADTATYLAASPDVASETGGYWWDRAKRDCEFRDMEQCHELWRRCEAMLVGSGPS
jgi:NAD(P)-dependent dehydrogenase (short-subunit alcohol dehydrogenase family)